MSKYLTLFLLIFRSTKKMKMRKKDKILDMYLLDPLLELLCWLLVCATMHDFKIVKIMKKESWSISLVP